MVWTGRLKSGTMEVNNCSIVLTPDILLIYSVQNSCPRPGTMLWFLVQVMRRYVEPTVDAYGIGDLPCHENI